MVINKALNISKFNIIIKYQHIAFCTQYRLHKVQKASQWNPWICIGGWLSLWQKQRASRAPPVKWVLRLHRIVNIKVSSGACKWLMLCKNQTVGSRFKLSSSSGKGRAGASAMSTSGAVVHRGWKDQEWAVQLVSHTSSSSPTIRAKRKATKFQTKPTFTATRYSGYWMHCLNSMFTKISFINARQFLFF